MLWEKLESSHHYCKLYGTSCSLMLRQHPMRGSGRQTEELEQRGWCSGQLRAAWAWAAQDSVGTYLHRLPDSHSRTSPYAEASLRSSPGLHRGGTIPQNGFRRVAAPISMDRRHTARIIAPIMKACCQERVYKVTRKPDQVVSGNLLGIVPQTGRGAHRSLHPSLETHCPHPACTPVTSEDSSTLCPVVGRSFVGFGQVESAPLAPATASLLQLLKAAPGQVTSRIGMVQDIREQDQQELWHIRRTFLARPRTRSSCQ